jgi:hypothetical protein
VSKHKQHIVETHGLSTAGECQVYVDQSGAVCLNWSDATVSLTAPDEAHDYTGQAALFVRLTPAEFQELVSRGLVAMASVEAS